MKSQGLPRPTTAELILSEQIIFTATRGYSEPRGARERWVKGFHKGRTAGRTSREAVLDHRALSAGKSQTNIFELLQFIK